MKTHEMLNLSEDQKSTLREAHESAQQRIESAGIGPPAVENLVGELSFFYIEIIHIRYL